ncbi:MAG TPA: chromosomal replication initiator protein DnaA [Verrucomicrobiae bacterium]|jgi:chromosomal replication initiator protein|nr:chromosomal replication initiator protein DnaA [Verrucomicrobiae bacterium]
MSQIWQEALERLREQLGQQNFETWIRPIRVKEAGDDEILLEVPNKFFRDWLAEHFLRPIRETLSDAAHHEIKVTVAINQKIQPSAAPIEKRPEREAPKTSTRVNNLIPKYTFENFVVGASNQFAHAASLAVANQPGDHYNPLFIYGGVGLGKTHLINAIGHRVMAKRQTLKVLYLSSESFMNELIASLRRDKMDEFKTRFRNIDALILDDVQFIAGKERTQEEFFHTFNSLYETHKQIIITSDKFPKEIPDLEDRLRNRFEWGLIADIQPPDMETRVAILQKKAEVEGVQLPHDVAIFLATHIDSNVRELEGSLTRLGAFASLTKATISIDLAKEVLQNTLRGNAREVTVESIQKTICDYYNIKVGDLKAKRRTKNIALPRQVAMYLSRKHTSTSFPAIGSKFGGRDHSTVIHAAKTIEKKMKEDPQMQNTIEKLEKNLNIKRS